MVVHVCCKRLSRMFYLFFTRMLQVFQTHVSSVFICFLLYVASVASGCFTNRSGCYTCCNGVSTVCSKCFICFRRILQKFHLDVAKVDRGVAHVAYVLEACCKSMFWVFQMFQRYISSVFRDACCNCVYGCCIGFTHMLHVFYSDVAYGCNGFQVCFRCVFKCFISMFQVFQLPSDVCCNRCIWMFKN